MIERILANTVKTAGCWQWQGVLTGGYGRIRIGGRRHQLVHRAMYEAVHAELPEVVMHTCDNRACVNPGHLMGGTYALNIQDCVKKGRFKSNLFADVPVTHCKWGHKLSGVNLYLYWEKGYQKRQCKQCKLDRKKKARCKSS